MSLTIPTTSDLNDRIVSQLQGSLGQTIPILPKAFVRVLAWMLAGLFVLLYRYCGFLLLQMFVAHATLQEITVNGKKIRPLVELGRLFGVGDPYAATRAELDIAVTVKNQTGDIPSGARLLFGKTAVIYDVVSAVPLNAGTVTVRIRASGDDQGNGGFGDIGNLQPGDVVSFANPLPNVATDAVVLAQVVTAADAESGDHYRARILAHVQRRPQGGAYADYRDWGLTVPGIVGIFPYAGDPGEVDIYVEADEESSGSPDGIPTVPQRGAVFDAIQLNGTSGKATRRPVGAAINVYPITRLSFDVEVSGLQPDTTTARDQIQEGLDEYIRACEPYIEGLSVLPRKDRITNTALGGVVEGIVSANGAIVTTVKMFLSATPFTAYSLGAGQKAKLGSVSYV